MTKKIMIINLGRQFGGVEKYVINIIKNIDLKKYNIHICVRKDSLMYKSLKKLEMKNIRIIEFELSRKSILKEMRNLRNYIIDNNINIIHNNGITSSVLGTIINKCNKKSKTITTVHGFSKFDRMESNIIARFMFDKVENLVFKYNSLYIGVSNGIKQYLVNKGLDKNKIEVIHHGIYTDNLENGINKYKLDKYPITIGSIGRLESVKGYEYLIMAISKLIKDGYDVKCILLGEGSELENLKKLSKDLELENRIEFLGFKENVKDYISKMDIYVQPSIQEAFGISILEAMNCQKIVIASDVGGIPEIIKDGENGVLFKSKDYINLANKIKLILDSKVDYTNLSKNAKLTVINEFDIVKSIKKLEEIYDKL